jgi:hypothetical protein
MSMEINQDRKIGHMIALKSHYTTVKILLSEYNWYTDESDNCLIKPSIIFLFKHCLELIWKILFLKKRGHSLVSVCDFIAEKHPDIVFSKQEITFSLTLIEEGKLKKYCAYLLKNNGFQKYEGSVMWLKMMIFLENNYKIDIRKLYNILEKYHFWDDMNMYYRYLDTNIKQPNGRFQNSEDVIEEIKIDVLFLDDCLYFIDFIFLSEIES